MATGWPSRILSITALLAFLYSLNRPWVSAVAAEVVLHYKPWEVLDGMAHSDWAPLERVSEFLRQTPQAVATFLLHFSLLVVALILGSLSIITNSAGGYASSAALIMMSAALLVYTMEQVQPDRYAIGSGTFLALASAVLYIVAALPLIRRRS